MKVRILLLLFTSLFSVSAFSAVYDVAFYTNGNFQVVVDALKRVALYYGANNAWILAVFGGGLLASAAVSAANSSTQQLSGNNPGSTFMTSLALSTIGLVVFAAGTVPKGEVHVYDQAKNQYESVAGVPAIISLTAGAMSSAVEAFRDSENTANAYTYGELSSGSPFELIKESMESSTMLSSYLIQNINQLYKDCGSSAIASGRLDIDEMRGNTYDLLTTLEGLKHNSIETTIYSAVSPNGAAATCNEAYTELVNDLSNPNVFDQQLSSICTVMGLDSAVSSEKVTCIGTLGDSFDTIYAGGSGSVDWKTGLQNMLIAQVISGALQSNSGSEAVDIELSRKGLSGSMGAMEASARFVPIIQGVLFSVIIGAAPVLLMFIVTPLIGAALKLYFGLLGFYSIWLMTDMVTLSAMEDSLYAATQFLLANKMGLLSVWSSHSAVVDSFSILGTARTVGISIAVLISATLFKVSAHGLAGFAQKVESNVDEKGADAGETAFMAENAGDKMDSLVKGNSNFAGYSNGLSPAMRSDTMDRVSDIRSGNLAANNLGGVNAGSQAIAEDRASSTVGGAQATQNEGFDSAANARRISTEGEFASSSAIQETAAVTGQSTRDIQEDTAGVEEGRKAGEAIEMGKGSGIVSNAINSGREEGARGRSTADHISKDGTDDIYMAEGQSYEKEIGTARAVDQLTDNSREYFQETGNRVVAETQGNNIGAESYTPDNIRQAKAGDYIEDITSSITKTDEAGGRLVDREQLTSDRVTSETNDDIAEQNWRAAIKDKAEISDVELSSMLVGSKEMNVNEENAEKLHDAGIINDAQLKTANREGGIALDVNATAIPQEGLEVQSTAASYSESSDVDKSISVDNSINYESSLGSMNEASARVLYSDEEQTISFIEDAKSRGTNGKDLATEVGGYSAGGIRDYFSQMDDDMMEGRGTVSAGVSTGNWFGLSASAETSASTTDLETQSVNAVSKHFAGVFGGIDSHFEKEVESGNMTQEEANQRTGEVYSDYYGTLKNALATGQVGELDKPLINGDLHSVWENYNNNNNLGIELSRYERSETLEDQEPQKPMSTGSGLYNSSEMPRNAREDNSGSDDSGMDSVIGGNMPIQNNEQSSNSMPPSDPERSSSAENMPKVSPDALNRI